jgi:hypothetical protein
MMDGWIVVRNWDKFQHYKNRRPVWIKLYTDLNSNDSWLALTLHERGLLTTVWVEYARSGGVLPVRRLVHTHENRYANVVHGLDSLIHAGFIQVVASKPLAPLEVEKEKKDLKTLPLARKAENPKPAPPAAPYKSNVQATNGYVAIARMIQNGILTDTVDLEAEIAGYHLDKYLASELRAMLA